MATAKRNSPLPHGPFLHPAAPCLDVPAFSLAHPRPRRRDDGRPASPRRGKLAAIRPGGADPRRGLARLHRAPRALRPESPALGPRRPPRARLHHRAPVAPPVRRRTRVRRRQHHARPAALATAVQTPTADSPVSTARGSACSPPRSAGANTGPPRPAAPSCSPRWPQNAPLSPSPPAPCSRRVTPSPPCRSPTCWGCSPAAPPASSVPQLQPAAC